jgi:hypothetical protein
MAKKHETTYVTYTEHEDGIWEAEYKPDIPVITLELAQQIVAERLNKQQGDPILLALHVPKDTSLITPEAQSYFAGPKGTEGLIAVSLIVNGTLDWETVKFLLLVKPSTYPVNTHVSLEEGKKFLSKKGAHGEPTGMPA